MSCIGFISVTDKWSRKARVWLDGVEITTRCYAADDRAGYVDCYRLTAEGKRFKVEDQGYATPARERLYGTVEIVLPDGVA